MSHSGWEMGEHRALRLRQDKLPTHFVLSYSSIEVPANVRALTGLFPPGSSEPFSPPSLVTPSYLPMLPKAFMEPPGQGDANATFREPFLGPGSFGVGKRLGDFPVQKSLQRWRSTCVGDGMRPGGQERRPFRCLSSYTSGAQKKETLRGLSSQGLLREQEVTLWGMSGELQL